MDRAVTPKGIEKFFLDDPGEDGDCYASLNRAEVVMPA